MGQFAQPLAKERVDFPGAQALADPLRQREVLTPEQTVVARLKGDSALGQLALEVLVPVDAELRGIGKVRAELEEEGAEVLIDAVEVVEVHHGRGISDPRDGASPGELL